MAIIIQKRRRKTITKTKKKRSIPPALKKMLSNHSGDFKSYSRRVSKNMFGD